MRSPGSRWLLGRPRRLETRLVAPPWLKPRNSRRIWRPPAAPASLRKVRHGREGPHPVRRLAARPGRHGSRIAFWILAGEPGEAGPQADRGDTGCGCGAGTSRQDLPQPGDGRKQTACVWASGRTRIARSEQGPCNAHSFAIHGCGRRRPWPGHPASPWTARPCGGGLFPGGLELFRSSGSRAPQ